MKGKQLIKDEMKGKSLSELLEISLIHTRRMGVIAGCDAAADRVNAESGRLYQEGQFTRALLFSEVVISLRDEAIRQNNAYYQIYGELGVEELKARMEKKDETDN